jgi:prepilin-type N-terminal cleavage/methylation domain-containing protein
MKRDGLTLLEILAALVALGLLAVTVMPIMARITTSGSVIEERISALEAMTRALDQVRSSEAAVPTVFSIKDMPDWQCSVTPLSRRRNGAVDIVGRQWLVMRVHGQRPNQVLERVVVAPLPEKLGP